MIGLQPARWATLLVLFVAGCTAPEVPSLPPASPMTADAVPTGRNLVGTVNRVSATELVLDVYGGPPPLVFLIRPKDRPNVDVTTLAALAGRPDRVRVYYEVIDGKDYVLRAERA